MIRTGMIVALIMVLTGFLQAQENPPQIDFEPSVTNPFGLPNPDALEGVRDFHPMIGICDCRSVQRNPDGSWQDTLDMIWKFKYIMNGFAVQDEVWRENDLYAGSIRMYHPDSAQWAVTFFSYPSVAWSPKTWHGGKSDTEIVLKAPQTAPNGMEGMSRLTFYDMTEKGFRWKGEWIKDDDSIVYPFWTIDCEKRQ